MGSGAGKQVTITEVQQLHVQPAASTSVSSAAVVAPTIATTTTATTTATTTTATTTTATTTSSSSPAKRAHYPNERASISSTESLGPKDWKEIFAEAAVANGKLTISEGTIGGGGFSGKAAASPSQRLRDNNNNYNNNYYYNNNSPSISQSLGSPAATLRCAACSSCGGSPGVESREAVFSSEEAHAARLLQKCLEIRQKYIQSEDYHVEPKTVRFADKVPVKAQCAAMLAHVDGDSSLGILDGKRRILWDPFSNQPPGPREGVASTLKCEEGIFRCGDQEVSSAACDVGDFCSDYVTLVRTMRDRSCISFVETRLRELDLQFQLHSHRNGARETNRQRELSGRDWYQVRKVDTHIHHSACFTQRQLMKFIRTKMREEMDTEVMEEQGRPLKLREVFSTAGISDTDDVNAERLCCMASLGNGQHDTFGRFDVFNSKYNPFGDKRLREVFLKTDNYIGGRYLAELTKEVMESYRSQKFVYAEWRISIYGKNKEEWEKLAKWFRTYDIQCEQIRWLVQVPRLYPLFRKMGLVQNFAEMLANIFEPLFLASMHPETYPEMFWMLQQFIGFDSVDDESQGTNVTLQNYPPPENWTSEENPPYTYWMYHMYANIQSLNDLRRSRGLNTFRFRPHCGEAGNVSHLCSGFMLADGVCHGVQLKESPVLQYLYYLAQVGLAVSPLSNDILFVPLEKSPFGSFFRRGLNVSLSTDDPLIIHLTEEALIEEYVVAARTFRLSSCDLCEIARNSVLMSGFEKAFKEWWVGGCHSNRFEGNDENKSNVPNLRLMFRKECWQQEHAVIGEAAGTR